MEKENIQSSTEKYIRVGTTYYKIAEKPLASGDTLEILISWNKETIQTDYKKKTYPDIPTYDGFCCIPSHQNYQKAVGTFYNQYHELTIKPIPGDCPTTFAFVKHIFQEHYELGLDYIKLLYEKPQQMLPVLCLVSREQNTGKTTFLNWMKLIFGKNMTLNTNDDFRSQFNSDWTNKLIIAVEEVLLDKQEDTERIKNLSTAKQFKSEAKGKDRQEVDFFGKFILCSNNEDNFICINKEETRFWVCQIPTIPSELKTNPDGFLEKLRCEISAFLYHILRRHYSVESTSRMWFSPKQIETAALRRLKYANTNRLEKEIVEVLALIGESQNLNIIEFQAKDLQISLENNGFRKNISSLDIQNIMKNNWQLKSENSSYMQYILCSDGSILSKRHKGRYYTITMDFLLSNFVDLLNH